MVKESSNIVFIIIGIIAVLAIIIGVYFYQSNNQRVNKIDKINFIEIPEEEIEVAPEVKDKLSKYRNFVLYGVDDAEGYIGRSDCIMLFSLNQANDDVKITSIYRDTYVEVEGHGYTKINHAYAYGGAVLAMNTINRNLDLDVKEFITINFNSVKKVVDYVGGVEVDITSSEAENIPGITGEGTYNLTGSQALAYGRIRKIDTDYKRTERMRTVIEAVFNKVKNMPISEINKFIDEILPEIQTNIEKSEISNLLAKITSFKIKNSMGWPYQVTGKTINGVWYAVPVTLESSVKKLHQDLFEDENYKPTETVKNISDNISRETEIR